MMHAFSSGVATSVSAGAGGSSTSIVVNARTASALAAPGQRFNEIASSP